MKTVLLLMFCTLGCIGADLTTKPEALGKEDIIKLYKVPVDQKPSYKAIVTCAVPMMVSLIWESSSDLGKTWKIINSVGLAHPIDSGVLTYKIDPQVPVSDKSLFMVEYYFNGVSTEHKTGIGGVFGAERTSLEYETANDPGAPANLLFLKQKSVYYRLSLKKSK